MFLRKVALRPVPNYAVVDEHAFESLASSLNDHESGLQTALDEGFRDLDRLQPILAPWLGEQVSSKTDEVAQSLGYFLVVTVYMAFREAFPTRLHEVSEEALHAALETLEADEELRADDPTEVLDSDDVLAMGQPALIEFIQHHVREAVEQAGDKVNLDDLDQTYRAVLVEVIALTHAVSSPNGDATLSGEVLA